MLCDKVKAANSYFDGEVEAAKSYCGSKAEAVNSYFVVKYCRGCGSRGIGGRNALVWQEATQQSRMK